MIHIGLNSKGFAGVFDRFLNVFDSDLIQASDGVVGFREEEKRLDLKSVWKSDRDMTFVSYL